MVNFNNKKLEAINSFVGEGTSFKGELISHGSLHIMGEVTGSINLKGDVFVGTKGKVTGDIIGARVVISGAVDGNIFAGKGCELLKTGKVNGEITCDKLLIEEGSSYQGKVNVCLPGKISEKVDA
jgi:cytoskeletal protein CcmA (bactofilin family)